jgi:hypothetical protein
MLTIIEFDIIKEVINEGGDIWDNPKLEPVKVKIKKYFRDALGDNCCYCRKNTTGEFNMVLDIEHILPKSKFKNHIFQPLNLSMSCKRCNMNVKREDTSFIVDMELIVTNPFISNNYKFIHPNLDSYFDNLKYLVEIINENKLIKYDPVTKKGKFTYRYFRLNELEIECLNRTQGIISEVLNTDIDPLISDELNRLFEDQENQS